MTEYTRTYPGLRVVQTRRGDTLWRVAARELGDPERWYELVFINDLVPPYLTDDPEASRTGVLVNGADLRVPAADDVIAADVDPAAVFGVDVALSRGALTAVDGDLARAQGAANLTQAVGHVVQTELGELVWHSRYGCGAHRLIGQRATPALLQFASALVQRAINADSRIERIEQATVSIAGDTLRAEIVAMAINGARVVVIPD